MVAAVDNGKCVVAARRVDGGIVTADFDRIVAAARVDKSPFDEFKAVVACAACDGNVVRNVDNFFRGVARVNDLLDGRIADGVSRA